MNVLPECTHRCSCAECWGLDGDMASKPLFSKRMAIIKAMGGLQHEPIAHRVANRFHASLFEQGYEVVRRHTPHE